MFRPAGRRARASAWAGWGLLLLLAACSPPPAAGGARLLLGAYTTPREAYAEILPRFTARWQAETGQALTIEEAYQASGAQSRAIVEGFEADLAALSLAADIDRIQQAGLIRHDWRSVGPTGGIVSTSVVALAVRAGNPLAIRDWADLARPGLEVLTPNPRTSGGAQWNLLALYGAALRGRVAGVPGQDPGAAAAFLAAVLGNVSVMDKAARDSMVTFENGVGDVAITYENEILVGRQAGQTYERVLPRSTILIENPAAVVDVYVDKHGTRPAAEALLAFLYTPEAQAVFARHGLRAVDAGVARATAADYPPVDDLFSIADLGGWAAVSEEFFGEDGVYARALAQVQAP